MGDLIACPFCAKNFTSMGLMESHAIDYHEKELLRTVHSGEDHYIMSCYQCAICGDASWSQGKKRMMIKHLAEHGGLVNHIIRVNIFDEIPLPF